MRTILETQRAAFNAASAPPVEARRDALRRLGLALNRHRDAFAAAISADFGNRSRTETMLAEIMPLQRAIAHGQRHVAGWMRPRRRRVDAFFQPATNWVEVRPLGVVGIVAPWNYPLFLTIGPLIDVLAAGNRAMIKPSELTPATGAKLAQMLGEVFAADQVAVVQGDVAVGREFCALPLDHLVFTGSTAVGRQVMAAAAANLVPVTLELGGKSPAIVAPGYDVGKAARSIAVGKFFNAGQTCTAPDYALVPRAQAERFGQAVIAHAARMYPRLEGNPDYTSIVSDRHFARLAALIAQARAPAQVLRHGADAGRRFAPTVVLEPALDGLLMREEIFGPILPVVTYDTLDDALAFVAERERPLALYVYAQTPAAEQDLLARTVSGGATVGGTLVHTAQSDLPFGGLGPSGMGAYHGREGFLRFSHVRGVHRPGTVSGIEVLRPPHGLRTRLALRFMLGK